LGATSTVYPSSWRILVTPSQLDPSAQAPCTSTIVGLAAVLALAEVALAELALAVAAPRGISVPAITSEPAIATVRLRGREVTRFQNMFFPFG
jgi:hypothetical protein